MELLEEWKLIRALTRKVGLDRPSELEWQFRRKVTLCVKQEEERWKRREPVLAVLMAVLITLPGIVLMILEKKGIVPRQLAMTVLLVPTGGTVLLGAYLRLKEKSSKNKFSIIRWLLSNPLFRNKNMPRPPDKSSNPDRWVYLSKFLMPRHQREAICGDLIEDRCEMRSAKASRFYIEFVTVWQLIVAILNSTMMIVIRKIISFSKN